MFMTVSVVNVLHMEFTIDDDESNASSCSNKTLFVTPTLVKVRQVALPLLDYPSNWAGFWICMQSSVLGVRMRCDLHFLAAKI